MGDPMCMLIVYTVTHEAGAVQIEVKEHHYLWDAHVRADG